MILKIAFNPKAEDTLALLALNDMAISEREISAVFRRPVQNITVPEKTRYFVTY